VIGHGSSRPWVGAVPSVPDGGVRGEWIPPKPQTPNPKPQTPNPKPLVMFERLNDYFLKLQASDKSEPPLFRVLSQKEESTLIPSEKLYLSRYHTAYFLELASLINCIPASICLLKSIEKMTPDYLVRRRFRFAAAFIITTQINLFLLGQYFRKVKKYPFEDKLIGQYFSEIKKLDPSFGERAA
jgi:hypothetical protein